MKFRGQSIPVLSLPPEWRLGVSASARHETVVAEALSGREDRRQRQARLLWRLSYSAISATARETGYMRGVLLAAREMPLAVPFWPQAVELSGAVEAGDSWLAIGPTADLGLFRAGGWALVMAHALAWEVVRVDVVQAYGLVTDGELARDWPGGTWVVPLLLGHLPRPRTVHETDELGTWRIDFEERFLEVTS